MFMQPPQSGWSTAESQLPSAPIAVFNRATLHALENKSLVLLGINSRVPSAPLQDSTKDSPIIWADLQEDPRSATLLGVGYADDTVSIFNAVTGERVWTGSAMGTATGLIVRDMLVRRRGRMCVRCWADWA